MRDRGGEREREREREMRERLINKDADSVWYHYSDNHQTEPLVSSFSMAISERCVKKYTTA